MEFRRNINDCPPDVDDRSLRSQAGNRDKKVLRDTYMLITKNNSPAQRLTLGCTTIYPTGTTTGHDHADREEVIFVVTGKGVVIVGEDEYPIEAGDALFVPAGAYHTTIQIGNVPLVLVWVTALLD